MKEQISKAKARSLLSRTGWKRIKQGYVWFGWENGVMCWQVWYGGAPGIYYRQACSPNW